MERESQIFLAAFILLSVIGITIGVLPLISRQKFRAFYRKGLKIAEENPSGAAKLFLCAEKFWRWNSTRQTAGSYVKDLSELSACLDQTVRTSDDIKVKAAAGCLLENARKLMGIYSEKKNFLFDGKTPSVLIMDELIEAREQFQAARDKFERLLAPRN